MALQGRFAFTENCNYAGYTGSDGIVRILDSIKGLHIADVSPNKSISSTTCTCVQWGRGRHFKQQLPHMPQKKRKRKSVETAVGDLGLLAIGTTSGMILLYSFSKGQMHTQLERGHTDEVTSLSWHLNGTTLYSASLDGHVVEWDVPSSQIKQKWCVSKSGVHSIAVCDSNHLLTADRTIKMWDLSTKKVIKKFTGHSTEVIQLLPVVQHTSSVDGDGSDVSCSYFLSAAVGDKVVNAWLCHPDSWEKNAIATCSLPEDPADLNLIVTRDQTLILAVLTKKGKVMIFETMLNGKQKKPLKAKTVVQATTSGSREEVSVPVPILSAVPRGADSDSPSLLVAHGSLLQPKFETVALRPSQPEIVLVVSSPEKKTQKADFSQVKTPEVSGSTVLYPSHITPVGPNTEPGKRKRKKSVSELTVVERLEAMGVEGPGQASGSGGGARPPKADQLLVQLTQGLHSKDAKLLTNAFQERNEVTIANTVKRLPVHVIHALVKEIIHRMYGHPQSGLMMVRWLKEILCVHMAYLTTIPDIKQTLSELFQYIEFRQQSLPKRMEVQGKLNLLLSRVASQTQVEEPAAAADPLLVYQDESDSDDMPMDLGASESEDNWEDSDAD